MTTKECKEQSGKCYVLVRPEYNDILQNKNKSNWLIYPEDGMPISKLANDFLPSPQNIITENPWIICSYDKSKVYILEDGKWANPDFQTFGTSVNLLTLTFLKINSTISRLPRIMLDELKGK